MTELKTSHPDFWIALEEPLSESTTLPHTLFGIQVTG